MIGILLGHLTHGRAISVLPLARGDYAAFSEDGRRALRFESWLAAAAHQGRRLAEGAHGGHPLIHKRSALGATRFRRARCSPAAPICGVS